MRKQLSQNNMKCLKNVPESGMGFHVVDVMLSGGIIITDCVIYNSEEIEIPNIYQSCDISKIFPHIYC